VNAGAGAFRAAYASGLRDYLRTRSETDLRVAYELAREAVRRGLSVLDLAIAHQEALPAALYDAADAGDVHEVAHAAGDFFLEGLSTYEMVQRGLREARDAVSTERRQTGLSRRLSSFLADTSLALGAHESLEEMLRLVAEQALELLGAECCVATVAEQGRPRSAEATSGAEDDRRWTAFVRWLDLSALYDFVRENGGSARLAGDQLADLAAFRHAARELPRDGWLAASLTALDGSDLGIIQLFDKQDGAFTGEDEAALVHLAQMASAAVERARLYRERG
jgi:phosphoserine phosphatase RsbU-like protein/GAF domain-containing protein